MACGGRRLGALSDAVERMAAACEGDAKLLAVDLETFWVTRP